MGGREVAILHKALPDSTHLAEHMDSLLQVGNQVLTKLHNIKPILAVPVLSLQVNQALLLPMA
ncbi:hypothetical protein ABW19_dt0203267 [Dactylella cylindrospora]|nr:hypothetical protein ABW19_dt0203267 [Dactylella cylindrospora]